MEILSTVNVDIIPVIAYREFMPSDANKIGYLCEGNQILPFYTKRKGIIEYMRFITGVIGSESSESEKRFLENAIRYIREQRLVDFIVAPHTSAVFAAYPEGADHCRFGSYIVDLSKSEEELWSAVHSKHRNVIRKAEKDGVIVSCDKEYSEACKNLVNETAARQHIPGISDSAFMFMNANPNVDFWVAIQNNEVVGASVLLWSKYSCYYIYGGSSVKSHAGAMNLLHWQAILSMKARGVRLYDFVGARVNPAPGSKQEGIQRFKSRFGGELKVGYMWRYSFSPLKSFLYKIYLKYLGIRKGSYTKDIIDQENENK